VLSTQFAVEKLSEHNQKENPTFFFVSSATFFSKKACFVVQKKAKGFARDKKKKEATASKIVQLAKQHISKSCD
jgi:hypothetical protein